MVAKKYFHMINSRRLLSIIGLLSMVERSSIHGFVHSSFESQLHTNQERLPKIQIEKYTSYTRDHLSWIDSGHSRLRSNPGLRTSTGAHTLRRSSSSFCINDSKWRYDNNTGSDGLERDCNHVSLIATGAKMIGLEIEICESIERIEHNGKTVYDACCACGGGVVVGSNSNDMHSEFPTPALFPAPFGAQPLPPSMGPTRVPSFLPTRKRTAKPTSRPSGEPSYLPTKQPSNQPSLSPTAYPSHLPTLKESLHPSILPTQKSTSSPSYVPSKKPSLQLTLNPTYPSSAPTTDPSSQPSFVLSQIPTARPSSTPSTHPSLHPRSLPSFSPTMNLSWGPTVDPSTSDSSIQTLESSTAFDIQVCSSYITRWITDLGGSCDSDLNGCKCTDASERIQNGEIDCNTVMCPDQCSVCDYCLETVLSCTGPTHPPTNASPTMLPSPRPSQEPSVHPPSSSPSNCVDDPDWRYEEGNARDGLKRDCRHVVLIDAGATGSGFDICKAIGNIVYDGKTVHDACCVCGGSIFQTTIPTSSPSSSSLPTLSPSSQPSRSHHPSSNPSESPTVHPSLSPTQLHTMRPTFIPSSRPSMFPTDHHSSYPSLDPTSEPSPFPSLLPSLYPTSSPSHTHSSKPTLTKSLMPTETPSLLPSTSPTINLCAGGNNGKYGNTTGNFLIVPYDYAFEYNQTLVLTSGDTVLDIINLVEKKLSDFLLEYFFEKCALYQEELLTSFGERMLHRHVDAHFLSPKEPGIVVGMSFLPVDLITGELCGARGVDSRCIIVQGRMNLYLTKLTELDLFTKSAQYAIKDILRVDRLVATHPAIMAISYIENGQIQVMDSHRDDDETSDNKGIEFTVLTWVLVGGGVGSLVIGAAIMRYFRTKRGNHELYDNMETDSAHHRNSGTLSGDGLMTEEISNLGSDANEQGHEVYQDQTDMMVAQILTDLEMAENSIGTSSGDTSKADMKVTILFPASDDDVDWNCRDEENASTFSGVEVTL